MIPLAELEWLADLLVVVHSNADLRMVFFRACDFLRRGILPVFVFDGPKRPAFKRDRNVGGNYRGRSEHELMKLFGLMGFEVRKAPGEAEAELAAMQERGEIDAVLTVRFPLLRAFPLQY